MKRSGSSLFKSLVLLSMLSILGGCAAAQMALSKKDLDVQTRTSNAIFVDAVSQAKRTIYLEVKSGVMEFDRRKFKQFVKQQFTENNDSGYKIVDDPNEAQFHMTAYILNLEKTSQTAAEAALGKGYSGGAVLAGAATGAVVSKNNLVAGAVAGGLVGGAADMVTGNLVKDVTYMLVSDVQIKEKAAKGVYVRKDSKVDTKISDDGSSRQTVSEVSNRKEYRTRIVTTANKVNLKLEDAEELMFKKTAYAMAGFF